MSRRDSNTSNSARGSAAKGARRASARTLDQVSKTLVVPLVARANARLHHPTFRDPIAERIVDELEWDATRFEEDQAGASTLVARAAVFDEIVGGFVRRHPDAQLLNLGAGLCTRFLRLDNGQMSAVDLDLPDVVELKREIVGGEGDRYRMVGASITDGGWLDAAAIDPQRPTLVTIEGVLVYLDPADVRRLIVQLADRLPGAELLFDYMHAVIVDVARRFPRVMPTAAPFRWGPDGGGSVAEWHPRLRLLAERPLEQRIDRRSRLLTRLLRPLMRRAYVAAHFAIAA